MARSSASSNAFHGTIATGGTLSEIIDTEGWSIGGLIVRGLTATLTLGTLTIQVSDSSDEDTFVILQNNVSGVLTNVAWLHSTADFAVSFVDIQLIRPYRYVRFVDAVAQTYGAKFTIAVKE